MKHGVYDDEVCNLEFNPGYTQDHIDKCDCILTDLLDSLQINTGADHSVLRNSVKTAVLALNELNRQCGHSMIETDQREDICTLIDEAVQRAGWDLEYDITEE